MLVLRRKIGEEVKIGDDVIVKVLAVNGRSIRLGIEAPRTTPVWRAEWHGNDNRNAAREEALATS